MAPLYSMIDTLIDSILQPFADVWDCYGFEYPAQAIDDIKKCVSTFVLALSMHTN